jgi:hypothetical protein
MKNQILPPNLDFHTRCYLGETQLIESVQGTRYIDRGPKTTFSSVVFIIEIPTINFSIFTH